MSATLNSTEVCGHRSIAGDRIPVQGWHWRSRLAAACHICLAQQYIEAWPQTSTLSAITPNRARVFAPNSGNSPARLVVSYIQFRGVYFHRHHTFQEAHLFFANFECNYVGGKESVPTRHPGRLRPWSGRRQLHLSGTARSQWPDVIDCQSLLPITRSSVFQRVHMRRGTYWH